MSGSIAFNPMLTTNAQGLFNTNSAGFTQGDAQDDPAVKFFLAGGIVTSSASTPLWGGLPISEDIPAAATQPGTNTLGSTIALATNLANTTGISVFNQGYGGVTTPTSTAPQFAAGSSINYYRFGSGARIPLRINPALVSLDGGLITQQVSWDYTAQWITTYDGTNAFPVRILNISTTGNKTVSYNSGTGAVNWIYTEAVAVCLI